MRAAQHGLLRDDVVGVAGMHLGDRDHRRIERRHVARHHALQRRDDLRGDDHRIDAGLRPRAVRALAGDLDVEQAAARHLRARADGELADVELGPVVHAEDLLAGELLEQPVLDHGLGAATAFLGRLEDEVHRAVEVARGREVLGGAQQHRRVAVMAAGMHAALVLAAMVEGVVLVHRQRIHVGAQPDGARIVADADGADHAGLADAGRDLAAPFLELGRHDLADVRSSSKPSSGWAWMSRRMAVSSAVAAAILGSIFMWRSGLQQEGRHYTTKLGAMHVRK